MSVVLFQSYYCFLHTCTHKSVSLTCGFISTQINVVFLVFALVSLARSKKMKAKTAHSDTAILKQAKYVPQLFMTQCMSFTPFIHVFRTILRATLILLPLLGITWLFGILTLNRNATVFAWLFTIFNSLQVCK